MQSRKIFLDKYMIPKRVDNRRYVSIKTLFVKGKVRRVSNKEEEADNSHPPPFMKNSPPCVTMYVETFYYLIDRNDDERVLYLKKRLILLRFCRHAVQLRFAALDVGKRRTQIPSN